MCTAVIYRAGDSYFGRNLDWTVSMGQQIVITPRNLTLSFRKSKDINHHYAMMGMALVSDNYPLYFEGMNEQGLAMAGLNFNGPAHYFPSQDGKDNIASFELIPFVLAQASSIEEVKQLLANANITDLNFSDKIQASPLHWMVADKTGAAIVIESTSTGLKLYDNPVGVLTNNPEFPLQLNNLGNYQSVSPANPQNTFAPNVNLITNSRGLGSHFLPGGMDSQSRFVKAAFTRLHAPAGKTEQENIANYFHILQAVEQAKGLDEVTPGSFEYTIYSDGMNLNQGIFYYRTYDNNQINAVEMYHENLDTDRLIIYPLNSQEAIQYQN